ncbi:MAG TPA: patatin-like phospholipase family protein [Thermoanaerobaculia bacterium]|nr:patatin-like phospholipase family protein [Thermoanaerobaculia bacterium]
MSSLPLDVHQILEEEYVSMYGPVARPGVQYTDRQILDPERARDILRACGIAVAANAGSIAAKLNDLVAANAVPPVESSPNITDRGRLLIAKYDEFLGLAQEQDPEWGARDLRRTIVDEAFRGSVKLLRDVRLDSIYEALHARARDEENPQPRTALCVSGGGIRSATFALGVIQGLASANILKKFDYLSTVSGGGYIGSWLSSWVRRHPDGVAGVEESLHRADTAVAEVWKDEKRGNRDIPDSNIDPEPGPVRHLREYSNYMSPRLGLLSGDSWTIASTYLRNLLLNLLVLVPLLALVLAIPRFFSWGLWYGPTPPNVLPWVVVIFTTIAFGYIGASRPLERGTPVKPSRLSANLRYSLFVVLPLVIAACALALFWARVTAGRASLTDGNTIRAAIAAVAGMVVVPWAAYYGRMFFITADARRSGFTSTKEHHAYVWSKGFLELFAVTVALVTSAALFWLLARKIFPTPLLPTPDLATLDPIARVGKSSSPQSQLYVCFAVPAALLVFFIQASIFVGLSSRRNEDADREWWGRGGALLLMVSIGLALFSFIAVFGPVALYQAPAILASIGGIAGVAAAVLGFSDKTPANQKEKEEGGMTAKLGNLGSALLVPLFVVFILASIALASTWLIHQIWGKDFPPEWTRRAAFTSEYSETVRTPGTAAVETKNRLPAAPLASLADLRSYAHLSTIETTTPVQLLAFLGIGIFALLLSLAIGVNKFSMHALYRNRLIRAYLGASRNRREPDAFTGFDESDNVQMWELRPELLWKTGIKQPFVDALLNAAGAGPRQTLAAYLWGKLDNKTQTLLQRPVVDEIALEALAQNINHLLLNDELAIRAKVPAPSWLTTDPVKEIGYCRALRNRALLDEHFAPDGIKPMPRPGRDDRNPVHVINTALNLTTGANLGWQQRMAESFTVTPFHSGSLYVGYRSSHEYGGAHGISLGTAVTISGAAASPNMGYHSSPAMAFLLTMFNVRLGSWLGNPGLYGQKSYDHAHPTSNLRPLIHELTGGSTDQSKWIYLSDGGHFENLGLYEMVLRRCHYIVVSDAGADPKFSFDDLGNAIRKIRTDLGVPIGDLGVPIDLTEKMFMEPRAEDGKFGEGRYVARGTIRYSAVDENGEDGTLIYIKAGIYQSTYLPRDVYNYAQESQLFPHEPTGDQFFSESQFESYRALGRHALNDICANYTPDQTMPGTPPVRIPIVKRFPSISAFDKAVRGSAQG